jgi:hypothetical protein
MLRILFNIDRKVDINTLAGYIINQLKIKNYSSVRHISNSALGGGGTNL